jgi:tetratricopeptide (TPR) repeat protein
MDLDDVGIDVLDRIGLHVVRRADRVGYAPEALTREGLFLLQASSLVEVSGDGSAVRMQPAIRDVLFRSQSDDEQHAVVTAAVAILGGAGRITKAAFTRLEPSLRRQWVEQRIRALDDETGVLTTAWGNVDRRVRHATVLYDFAGDLHAACVQDSGLFADDPGTARLAAAFLSRTAFLLMALHRGEQAHRLFDVAERMLRPLDDPAAHSETLARQGDNLDLLGKHDEARTLFERALALRSSLNVPGDPEIAHIHNALGLSLFATGAYADAESHFGRALEAASTAADSSLVGAVYFNLATLHERTGVPDACALYAAALAALEAAGIRWMIACARERLDRCRGADASRR